MTTLLQKDFVTYTELSFNFPAIVPKWKKKSFTEDINLRKNFCFVKECENEIHVWGWPIKGRGIKITVNWSCPLLQKGVLVTNQDYLSSRLIVSLITKLSSKKNKGTQCSEPVLSCSSIAQHNYDCYSNTQIEIFQSDLHSFPYRNS